MNDPTHTEVVNFEKGYLVAGKITECYQAAKRVFGSNFNEHTKPIRVAMQDLMDKSGCNEVTAGLRLMEFLKDKNKLDSMTIMMVAATTYAICEAKE